MEVHKISKTSEITDLDLYLTDPSESTEAERLPHPTMSLFMKPQTNRFPKLAAGREVTREKKSSASRKTQTNLPDDVGRLKEAMEQAKNEKMENSYVWSGCGYGDLELTCLRLVPGLSALLWAPVQSAVRQRVARTTNSSRPRQPRASVAPSAGLALPVLP